ncbi:MAG TPA: SH3 domain-containing protein [Thiobacillaceae bacterium]|nr:SH3 domain-containing protein [Thiobacillaceae bacterium]HNU62927.1 SH3 domain-containing protein [Thiobacillaceae bacterium]
MTRMLHLLCLGLLTLPVWAGPGTLIKDEDLKSSPSVAAARVAALAKGSNVEILARQGGWTQIRAGGHTGWVRILSVRANTSTGSAADIAALASRRDSRVVAVAGVRGLNEEELKMARFDAQELQSMERYRATAADATGFARAAGLSQRRVPYLPAPAPAGSDPNAGPNAWGGVQ